jgi:single-stranded-DNA-specific exonuclease
MREWREPQDVHVPEALRAVVGGHPLVAKTLVRRGLTDVEAARAFLDPAHYEPTPPTALPNLVRAAERLEAALRGGERICVWGDFDVDGQTATTVLVSTLRDLAAQYGSAREAEVTFHIPNRKREGHGVNRAMLEQLIADGAELILTCDTGVTAHEPIAYAQAQGVDVIVTDHHDLPPTLPDAYAVTDPKMLPETHPLRHLPGVGVAYKLAELLYQRAGRAEDVEQHLDLVALGIVADVATQSGDVRYLLQRGLETLRQTGRLGLRKLMNVAEINRQWLTEEHIGYELAPRLNALGRLDDATPAVELLTTDDLERARILAAELNGLNARRKMMCDQVMRGAESQLERDPSLLERGALVLSDPHWPGGIIGIVAGRLAEKYHRPTILIAAPPDGLAKGSARSIEGCDISAAIAAQGELLERFGGHPMAAGLSIDPERIPEFRRALSRTVRKTCQAALETPPALQIDGYVELSDISLDLVEQVERLAPFGPGNPPLTLVSRELTVRRHSTVGRDDTHRQLLVADDDETLQKVIWWQGADKPLPEGRFDLAYVVRASNYRGQRQVQVEWIDARPIEEPAEIAPPEPSITVVDWRSASNPRVSLQRLRAEIDVQVWAEGQARAELEGRHRRQLEPSDALVIWTAPPGPPELQAALAKVAPQTVYLVGREPGLDRLEPFLKQLAGLVKRALRANDGTVAVAALAAATAHRERTVRAGLDWLAARGSVVIEGETDGELHLAAGDGVRGDELPAVTDRLRALLEETAAYRAYFARAEAQALME